MRNLVVRRTFTFKQKFLHRYRMVKIHNRAGSQIFQECTTYFSTYIGDTKQVYPHSHKFFKDGNLLALGVRICVRGHEGGKRAQNFGYTLQDFRFICKRTNKLSKKNCNKLFCSSFCHFSST